MANKLAVVLSGGGNRGAIEVGVLQSLVEHGIQPDLVVGTSAGALNGLFFCMFPDAAGIQRLINIWLNTTSQDVFPGNLFSVAWRILTNQNGFVSNTSMINYVKKNIGRDDVTFGDLKTPLYVATTDLISAKLVAFGDDKSMKVLLPVVASAAFPLVVEPVLFENYQLTDGGVVEFAPLKVAMARGAQEGYVIDLAPVLAKSAPLQGTLDLALQMLDTALHKGMVDDLEDAQEAGVTVHHIQIPVMPDLSLFDFSKTKQLIADGKAAMDAYLRSPQPNVIHR